MAYASPPPHASTSAPTTFQTSPAESNYPLSPSPSPSSNRRTSANGNSGSNSSKSVLTIALQRAQSAVLLDSANNVVGAVAAYSQAVKLLEQVMIRVEETTKKDRSSRVVEVGAVGDSEVEIKERLRRLAKLERKDRAKEEEARRLKVIHDTYLDRIRMLSIIEPTTTESSTPVKLPSSVNGFSPSFLNSPSTTPPTSPQPSHHRTMSSLSNSTIPTTEVQPLQVRELRGPWSSTETLQPQIGTWSPLADLPPLPKNRVPIPNSEPVSAATMAVHKELGLEFNDVGEDEMEEEEETSILPWRRESLTPKMGDGGFTPSSDITHSVPIKEENEIGLRPWGPLERRPSPQLSSALAGRRKKPSVDLGEKLSVDSARPKTERSSSLSTTENSSLHSYSFRKSESYENGDNNGLGAEFGSQGLIARRRKSKEPSLIPIYGFQDFKPFPRPATTENLSYQAGMEEFGGSTQSEVNGNSNGITRSRALSQPGKKRPSFSSYATEPFPTSTTLENMQSRSRSNSPTLTRKLSIPPSSLPSLSINTGGAPPLERSQSNSSSGRNGSFHSSPNFLNEPFSAVSMNFPNQFTPPSSNNYLLNTPPPYDSSINLPISSIRRPFQLMKSIHLTILYGGYLTPKLFVTKEIWSQNGIKLNGLEIKLKMIDLIVIQLDSFITITHDSLDGMDRLIKELETFENFMEGISNNLDKKLSNNLNRLNSTAFGTWSSKLSRSLDRVTNSKSTDSPASYVESLIRLFTSVQLLDSHLYALEQKSSFYATVSNGDIIRAEIRFKRISDFFKESICSFLLVDLAILLDKWVKRGGNWIGEF